MERGRDRRLRGQSEAPGSFGAVNLDGFAVVLSDDPDDIENAGLDLADEPAFPGTHEDAARQALDLPRVDDARQRPVDGAAHTVCGKSRGRERPASR